MKILKDTVYRCVDAEAQGKIKRTALIFTGLISLLAFVLTVWNIVILYFEFDFYSALAVFVFSSGGFLLIWKEASSSAGASPGSTTPVLVRGSGWITASRAWMWGCRRKRKL